jgi:prevent-host-death family protein
MRKFSSAGAKNHFGLLIDAARIAPVAVTKYDKPFVVVMAVKEYERVMALAELENKIGKAKEKAFNQAARSGSKK